MATRLEVEKLTDKVDFGLWKVKMEALLTQQGLYEALVKKKPSPSGKEKEDKSEEFTQIDAKARSIILLCLGDKALREVSRETSAVAVWEKLGTLYMVKTLANRLYMKQKLYSFRMAGDKSVLSQLDDFNKILDDLENIDVKLDEEDKALILLNSLPKTFENFRETLLFGNRDSITLEDIQVALKCKELHKSSDHKVTATGGEGLNIKKGKPSQKQGKKPPQKQFNKSDKKPGEGWVDPEDRKCFHCQEPGHYKKDCSKWKQMMSRFASDQGNPKKRHQANSTSANKPPVEEDCESLIICDSEILVASASGVHGDWVLDSGCSFHMSPVREWFSEFTHTDGGTVMLGNDHTCQIRGIGSIKIKMYDGKVRKLSEVRYVPDLRRNLISLGVFDSKGYKFESQKGNMKISKEGAVLIKGVRRNDLYFLVGSTVTGHSHATTQTDNSYLWHSRLGHLGNKGLEVLAKDGLLAGNHITRIQLCEHCIAGKTKRMSFPTGVHISTEKLEYIHSDLWGPSQHYTKGGGRYFISLIDDYSRKVWVYILKTKSEAFMKFRDWVAEVENKSSKKVQHLRTDNGLEFLSQEFINFCKEKGITRHLTVPGTPQQNGVAERMNQTLLERVRCVLSDSGLHKSFWGEIVTSIAYLINRSPSSAISFKSPQEKWSGVPAEYSHLKVLGCLAYAHVKQDKLDPRAIKCVFVGYPNGIKGYKLWCLDTQKFFVSRDVTFDETKFPMKEVSLQKGKEVLQQQGSDTVSVESNIDGASSSNSQSKDNESVEVSEQRTYSNYQLARDRSRREITPPVRYRQEDWVSFALFTALEVESYEPRDYREAITCDERDKWLVAVEEELLSLGKNSTWKIVTKPQSYKLVGCKWIFKKKPDATREGGIRYKARLVAKGFSQKEGIDYNEIFSPVVKHCSIRILLALVAKFNLELHQMDVTTAFLHGKLDEDIYMKLPDGVSVEGGENKACKLQRSLYGLKQSPRQWYLRFDEFIQSQGFSRSMYDSCVYIKREGSTFIYLLLYVDDMLIACESMAGINKVKQILKKEFEMKDLGEARVILGMQINRKKEDGSVTLSQSAYLDKVLCRYNMNQCKSVSTPIKTGLKLSIHQGPKTEEEMKGMAVIPYASSVGSLMYAMVCCRPDLTYVMSVLSRFMCNPGKIHWEAAKWAMRYLKGSAAKCLKYKQTTSDGDSLVGYVDADFAANIDTRKSLTGYVFTLFGTAVSWKSTHQSVVALSTTEAEYVALTEAVKEGMWLQGILSEFGIVQDKVTVFCDNQSAIHLSKHQGYHERTKHIDVKLYFVRDLTEKGSIVVSKIATAVNPADAFTKALQAPKFELSLGAIGMI